MWGTLLGCVREGRLLKNDNDIDLGILWTDYAKKERLVASMRRRGYYVPMDSPYKLKFKRPFLRLMIDVDVFYPWHGKMISCLCEDGKMVATSFDQNAFDHFADITFLGDIQVLIPDPASSVLTTIYGDWRTPNSNYESEHNLLNRLHIPPGQPMPRPPITTPDVAA
jgi:phosphorylcholine metabolism protein LicD